ncbi:hypothetical protein [Bdellovibrio sp. HCB337]|uniref:hypothetical protein n=1 Tax=Bdellovibrio sp. HCB337 TaxID=3394358 RepID=UPI0039A4FAEC
MRSSSYICLALFLIFAACAPKNSTPLSPPGLPNDKTVVWSEKGKVSATEAQKSQVPLKDVGNIKTDVTEDALYIGGSGYLQDESLTVRQHRYQIVKLSSSGLWASILELNYGPTEPGSMLFQRIVSFTIYNNTAYVLREVTPTAVQVYKVGPQNSLIKYGPELSRFVWPKIEMAFNSAGELWLGSFSSDEGYGLYRLSQNQWKEMPLPNIGVLSGLLVDGNDVYVYGVRDKAARVFRFFGQDRWEMVFESGYVADAFSISAMSFSALKGHLSVAVLYTNLVENKSLSRFFRKSAGVLIWEKEFEDVTPHKSVMLQGVLSTDNQGFYGVTSSWHRGVKVNTFYWYKKGQELVANRYALGEPASTGSHSSVIFQNHLYFLHQNTESPGIVISDFGSLR